MAFSRSSGDKEAINCHVTNRCSITGYTFKWTLQNALQFPTGVKISSPDICPHPNTSWNFWFQKSSKTDPALSVHLIHSTKCFGRVEGTVSALNSDLKVVKDTTLNFELSDKSADVCLFQVPTKDFAESNDIHLLFRLKIYGLDNQQYVYNNCLVDDDELHRRFFNALQSDLQSLWKGAQCADVTLVAEGRTIPAHKSILCSRSPVIAKMFQHRTVEVADNTIKLTDISFEVLNKFVGFLYALFPDFGDVEDVYSLYYAADKYQVLDLRLACGQALLDKVTPDDACRLLDLAGRHDDKKLLDQVCQFISFHFASIAKTDDWNNLVCSNPKVVTTLLQRLASDISK